MTDMAEKAMRFWMALPTSCSEKRKESALFVFQNTAGYLHTPLQRINYIEESPGTNSAILLPPRTVKFCRDRMYCRTDFPTTNVASLLKRVSKTWSPIG
jgi:hypothetical protein